MHVWDKVLKRYVKVQPPKMPGTVRCRLQMKAFVEGKPLHEVWAIGVTCSK